MSLLALAFQLLGVHCSVCGESFITTRACKRHMLCKHPAVGTYEKASGGGSFIVMYSYFKPFSFLQLPAMQMPSLPRIQTRKRIVILVSVAKDSKHATMHMLSIGKHVILSKRKVIFCFHTPVEAKLVINN